MDTEMDTWCVSNEKKWRKDTISKDESTWVPGELGPLLRSLLWGNLVILTGMPCGSMVYLIRPPDVLVGHEMISEWNG